MKYPKVSNEFDTVAQLLAGRSLARFGDGELKIMHGKGYIREPVNPELTAELRQVFFNPHPDCLVGIPTMDKRGPKAVSWFRHRDRFLGLIAEGKPRRYVSAFVSRPDSAPAINCREFALQVQGLWVNRRTVVLCERDGSMIDAVRLAGQDPFHIVCPRHEAYKAIDRLEDKIIEAKPEVAILSCGPTASCLANRLAARGVHAIDLGSAGGFLRRLLEE